MYLGNANAKYWIHILLQFGIHHSKVGVFVDLSHNPRLFVQYLAISAMKICLNGIKIATQWRLNFSSNIN